MEEKTFKKNDKVGLIGDKMQINIGKSQYCYSISDIIKIAILTTDKGPFFDDVALAVSFDESVFVIPSEHSLYEEFLFDEISKKITIDYQSVMDASTCTDNAEFIIYHK